MAAKAKRKTTKKKTTKRRATKKKAAPPQPPTSRSGPRLRLTPERMNRIIGYKRIGAPDVVAYQMASVAEKSFYRWRGRGEQVEATISESGLEAWENISMAAADLLHLTIDDLHKAKLIDPKRTEQLSWGEARMIAIEMLDADARIYFRELEDVAEVLGVPAFHADVYLQFVSGLRRAVAESELEAIATVRFNVTHRKNWVAAMTFLERRFPERWRRQSDVSIERKDTKGEVDKEAGRKAARAILANPEATAHINEALRLAGRTHPALASRPGAEDD